MQMDTTRRAAIGAFAAIGSGLGFAAVATATAPTPFMQAHSRFIAARDAYNNCTPADGPRLERPFLEAFQTLDAATPTNWQELALALRFLADTSEDEDVMRLADHADRLVRENRA